MAQDKTKLFVGVATLKAGDNVLGYTRDGVTISFSRDRSNIECDQTRAPLYTEVTSESAEISTNLLQLEAQELEYAGIISADGRLGLSAGESETSFALEVYGTRKDGTTVKFTFPSCTVNPGDVSFSKEDASTIAVTFVATYDETIGAIAKFEETA